MKRISNLSDFLRLSQTFSDFLGLLGFAGIFYDSPGIASILQDVLEKYQFFELSWSATLHLETNLKCNVALHENLKKLKKV